MAPEWRDEIEAMAALAAIEQRFPRDHQDFEARNA
jgi:hypothetical protein